MFRLLIGRIDRFLCQRRYRRGCGSVCGATNDTTFEQTIGLDLLVHMARLWRSLSRQHSEGRFRIEESPA